MEKIRIWALSAIIALCATNLQAQVMKVADLEKYAKENYGDVAFEYINAHVPMFNETEVELHWRVNGSMLL